jgi:hypothetical protein
MEPLHDRLLIKPIVDEPVSAGIWGIKRVWWLAAVCDHLGVQQQSSEHFLMGF